MIKLNLNFAHHYFLSQLILIKLITKMFHFINFFKTKLIVYKYFDIFKKLFTE